MNYLESYKQAQREWRQASAILGGLWGNCPAAASDFEDQNGEGQVFRDKVSVQHLRQADAQNRMQQWKRLPKWQRKVCAIRYETRKAARLLAQPIGMANRHILPESSNLSLRIRVRLARAQASGGPEATQRTIKSIVAELAGQMSMETHK